MLFISVPKIYSEPHPGVSILFITIALLLFIRLNFVVFFFPSDKSSSTLAELLDDKNTK